MLEMGLFWLGVALVIAAIVMLFLDSFQSKKIWAVISLLILFPLLIHIITHWSSLNVRKALYILIVGILGIAVSISGGALSHLSFLPDHEVVKVIEDKIAPPEDTPLPNQQQADDASLEVEENYDPLLTGSEYEQLEIKEIVPEEINQVARKTPPAARYQVIEESQRVHAINKRVRVIMADGATIEGILTEIIDESVIIESEVNGGSLGLSYKNDQIQSMAVRLLEGEQLVPPVEEDVVGESNSEKQATSATSDHFEGLEELPRQPMDTQETEAIVPKDVQQPISQPKNQDSEVEPELEINSGALEKVEEIVGDTKLLDSVDGQ
ncbi:MAG: hypothetical protein R8G33_09025 [Gammaproteobacteria bacterium]|nr:hypothetical protein [Gammaproteobacteria bacterium]